MNTMRATFLFGLLATVGLLAFQPTAKADPGDPGWTEETNPIEVGKAAGIDKNDEPIGKDIKAKTATGTAAGDITMDLKNTSGKDVTDVHVKIVEPTGYKIKQISTSKTGGSPFTEVDPDGSGSPKTEATAASPTPSGGDLDNNEEIIVDVTIVKWDADAEEWVEVENEDVTLEVWWTRGNSRNIVVSATSSKNIGDGDPRTTLASMNTAYSWGFDFSVLETTESTAELNELAIAECDGFRFQEGSLVLRPTNSTRFSDDLESFSISARSQDNDNVLGTGRFSAGEPRIDSRGNFVIDITRSQNDTEHIVIVLSGLNVEGLSGHEVGQKVYADVSGAAVAGYCMHRYFHLLTVVE